MGFGLAATSIAGLFRYGPRLLLARRSEGPGGHKGKRNKGLEEQNHTSIHDNFRQVLTEARVIIPGNQALMGFQFFCGSAIKLPISVTKALSWA